MDELLCNGLLDFFEDSLVMLNNKGVIIEVNQVLVEKVGYVREEFIGKNVAGLKMLTSASKLEVVKNFGLRLAGRAVKPYQVEFVRSDGERLKGMVVGKVLKNSKGELVDLIKIVDLAEVKTKVEKLVEVNAKERKYLEKAGVIVVVLDLDSRVQYVNKKTEEFLELGDRSEVLGQDWIEAYIPDEEKGDVRDLFDRLANGDEDLGKEYVNKVKTKSGKIRTIAWNNGLVHDANGQLVGVVSTGRDITDELRVQEELTWFRLGIERSEDVMFMTDYEGKIFYVNPMFEKVYGYSRVDWLGRTPRLIKGSDKKVEFYDAFWKQIKTGKSIRVEFNNKKKNGESVIMDSMINPLVNSQGKVSGFFAIQRDVTGERNQERELAQTTEKLKKMNQMMVGREIKMVELKKEIRSLKNKNVSANS